MNSVLTLVLSSTNHPYDKILSEGQEKTWIEAARRHGNQVIPYLSISRSLPDRTLAKIERKLERHEWVNRLGLNSVRPIRRSPGNLSQSLLDKFVLSGNLDEGLSRLHSSVEDTPASIGLRTLEAFKYALDHYSFDYLARTNTSSYVDVNQLSRGLPPRSSQHKVFALQGSWGRTPYPSGALYVLPRQTVELVADRAGDWQHEYIDDVALGLLLAKHIRNLEYEAIPRFEFPFEVDYQDMPIPSSFVHYRCKSAEWRTTVRRQWRVHAVKYPQGQPSKS